MSEDINIGLNESTRSMLASELSNILSDSFTIYVKTLCFHWNIKGPFFESLHKLSEAQYMDLVSGCDDIAERIRALGFDSPAAMSDFLQLTSIKEFGANTGSEKMLKELTINNEELSQKMRELILRAETSHDPVTADLLTSRMRVHEKNAWMLRSFFSEKK